MINNHSITNIIHILNRILLAQFPLTQLIIWISLLKSVFFQIIGKGELAEAINTLNEVV